MEAGKPNKDYNAALRLFHQYYDSLMTAAKNGKRVEIYKRGSVAMSLDGWPKKEELQTMIEKLPVL